MKKKVDYVFTARVHGWSKPRRMIVDEDSVYLIVNGSDCFCNTCVGRFVGLLRHFDKHGIKFEAGVMEWGTPNLTVRFLLPKDFTVGIETITKFLNDKTGLKFILVRLK